MSEKKKNDANLKERIAEEIGIASIVYSVFKKVRSKCMGWKYFRNFFLGYFRRLLWAQYMRSVI